MTRVALVSTANVHRSTIAAYLENAGFDIHACVELDTPASFDAVVLLGTDRRYDDVAAQARSWMKATRTPRIVVVTSKPAALRELAAAYPARLVVLAAPVFGWELVDTLRSTHVREPRGA